MNKLIERLKAEALVDAHYDTTQCEVMNAAIKALEAADQMADASPSRRTPMDDVAKIAKGQR
jgi:hypothetical protein